MHQLNVLIFGPSSFISTLNELKPFLKFNHFSDFKDKKFDIILFHEESLKDNKKKNQISKSHSLKIFVSSKNKKPSIDYDEHLQIPTTLKEINNTVEKIVAKKKFFHNSSIKVKEYFMDKNEKRLFKENNFVILTEKEIKLIELLLNSTEPMDENFILNYKNGYSFWKKEINLQKIYFHPSIEKELLNLKRVKVVIKERKLIQFILKNQLISLALHQ